MSADTGAVLEALRHALASPLPGREAQAAAWPRPLPPRDDPDGAEGGYGTAAVLLALCPVERLRSGPTGAGRPQPGAESAPEDPREPRFCLPLIRRPAEMRHHGGQISLPGGECVPGETARECALREAEEEIGLRPAEVDLLGLLTPVHVPVSRFRIQPVVAWIRCPPRWVPQAREVAGILTADPDRLLEEGLRGVVRRERDGMSLEAPAYVVPDPPREDALVWGATAIILAEFLAVWRQARSRLAH